MLGPLASRYQALHTASPEADARLAGRDFLQARIEALRGSPCELPDDPAELAQWMFENTRAVQARYAEYLADRKAGAPRRMFRNRAHALNVLRSVAPTKLVDGAWLYGVLQHWDDPALADLVRTYVEELGEGEADKNHVVLYRELLSRHALSPLDDLDDSLYEQGLLQLALGWNAEAYLPEIVGFNLSYEQLPFHLLLTAYELNELGLDPYYFTLHVTVDNGSNGHARRACDAALQVLPLLGDPTEVWERMRDGARLACAGRGTMAVAQDFDIDAEVLRIFRGKCSAGRGLHSDYCRVGGRTVNEWLGDPAQMEGFLGALKELGWIRLGEPAANSRFWQLLMGPRAEMFGVFSSYELQVIHDWLRGDASADGLPYTETEPEGGARRRATFRAARRAAQARNPALVAGRESPAAGVASMDIGEALAQMSPGLHWTPAGLAATRWFWREVAGAC